jgi:N-acetylglucosamine-6-phosphate deacetylase
VFAEIIADGYHVDKAYVMDAIKRKGTDKVVVITDSMFPTMLEGLDKFSMLGVEGRVSSNGEYLQIADRGNALFGSTLTMDKAFSNILNWLTSPVEGIWYKMHEPLNFEEALLKASEMCSGNPARVIGILGPTTTVDPKDMSCYTGSIETGKSADVLIADITGIQGDRKVKIERAFVNGQPV